MSMSRWLSGSESRQDSQRTIGDTSVSNDQFTDTALELPLLGRRQNPNSFGAALYLLVLVLYAVVVITAPWLFVTISQFCPAILCSCNVLLLGCTALVQKHLSKQVKKERRQGFLKFSEHLKPLIPVPFIVLSYGKCFGPKMNVRCIAGFSMGVSTERSWCPSAAACTACHLAGDRVDWGSDWSLPLSKALEVEEDTRMCIQDFFIQLLKAGRIRWHNLSHLQPDVVYSLHSVIQPPTFLGDLRYLDGGRLAEQQALLLRYQQENLRFLHEEVLRMQESLSKYERSQDGAPQVDVIHILASREQELRAMTAERDQLQSELRLARGLIAERESSVIQIRATNDRFVEENERLRSMLSEWSSRTAKLELALEAERVSNAELNKRLAILRHANTESTGT